LVLVAVAAVCVIFFAQQSYRLHTRTVSERQFTTDAEWWENDLTAIREFEARHGLNPEAQSGLRLAIHEWPDWKYLISIESSQNGTAKGAIFAVAYDGHGPAYERDFRMDMEEANLFFGSFDEQIDGYWGSTAGCTDGTGFQFERWTDEIVSSGRGNAACHRHYAELMGLVAEPLVVQLRDAPFDWRTWLSAKRHLALRNSGG
jgi:hypothetical protein